MPPAPSSADARRLLTPATIPAALEAQAAGARLLKDYVTVKLGNGNEIKMPRLNLGVLPGNFPEEVKNQLSAQLASTALASACRPIACRPSEVCHTQVRKRDNGMPSSLDGVNERELALIDAKS